MNHELIILDINHGLNTDVDNGSYSKLTQDEWNKCMELLSSIRDLYIPSNPSITDLTNVTLKEFIGKQAAVILLCRPDSPPEWKLSLGPHARHGFFTPTELNFVDSPVYRVSEDEPNPAKMSKDCLDAMRNNPPNPQEPPTKIGWAISMNTANTLKIMLPGGGVWADNIIELAAKCRPVLHSDIWTACTKQTYPKVIQFDAFVSDVTTLAIAITKYHAAG